MSQNIYDDPTFFAGSATLDISQRMLSRARSMTPADEIVYQRT